MAENAKVRLASIGLGWWGSVLAGAVSRTDEAEVVTCFARSAESREAFAREHGCETSDSLESIWSDPEIDGVLIATPHTTHADLVEQAAAAGKNIFVEKPLTLSVDEGRRCVAAAERAGVVFQVGHNKRRQTGNRMAQQKLVSGELGQLQAIETNISVPIAFKDVLPEWRQTREECPAGGMTALGVHMIDTIMHLGGPVREVDCRSRRVSGRLAIDDVTMVILELESGVLAYLGTMTAIPNVAVVNVYGTEGAAYSEADGKYFFFQRRGEPYRTEVPVETVDTVQDELVEFAACIRGGKEPETGARTGLAVVEVFDAIVRSATTGEAVEVG